MVVSFLKINNLKHNSITSANNFVSQFITLVKAVITYTQTKIKKAVPGKGALKAPRKNK